MPLFVFRVTSCMLSEECALSLFKPDALGEEDLVVEASDLLPSLDFVVPEPDLLPLPEEVRPPLAYHFSNSASF